MKTIETEYYKIHFGRQGYQKLNDLVEQNKYSKVFVITDGKAGECCLDLLCQNLSFEVEIIEIEEGEENKNIETCIEIWNTLLEREADRKSLVINLGGGVVCDLGGFVASTFTRGVDFINIPTTLLSMVDASVGGKTGVNLQGLKNQIGVVQNPKMVLIDIDYLLTLDSKQLRSGLGEMFKHGLIDKNGYWQKMKGFEGKMFEDLQELVYESVLIKYGIVSQDPKEKGIRKYLNFGHTTGHAIESYFLREKKISILHGEAVAIGIVIECYLSVEKLGFDMKKCEEVKNTLGKYFKKIDFLPNDIEQIYSIMKFDKKNSFGKINFVLLKDFGEVKTDCQVEKNSIDRAFEYYDN